MKAGGLAATLLALLVGGASASCPAQIFSGDSSQRGFAQSAKREQANEAIAGHEYPRALALLTPLAQASPKDAHLLYDLGAVQDALDQTGPAERSYRQAILDSASALEPRVALGLLLARSGRMEDARAELAAAAAITDGDKLLRGRALRALARIDEKTRAADAQQELSEALKLSPETSDDRLLAAELASADGGDSVSAESSYRQVLVDRPNDPDASAALGHLLVKRGKASEAETLLAATLAAHPEDPAVTVGLASALAVEGKAADAVPLVKKLHAVSPENSSVSTFLAELYLQTKDYADAAPLLSKLSQQAPSDMQLIRDWADALIHLKQYAEAQRILEGAVAQPASFASPAAFGDAAGALAFASSENGQPQVALRALALRATVLPNSACALFLAAISHDKLHHVKLAQQAYNQFLAASNGANPDQEFEARHRLIALEHTK